jgi:glycosyltransferase involved in cell wall biosynthesis
MKVLHVIPAVASRYGGPSTAVLQMCRALAAAGTSVEIATTDADGPGRLNARLGEATEIDGVPARVFARQWSEAFKYSRPLAAWLDGHMSDYDVVHVHALLSHACVAAARACRRHGVPYIVRPLGTLDPWSLAQKPWRKRLLLAAGGRAALAGAAAVHYTAAEEQRLVEASFPTQGGFVAPLGIDDHLLQREPLTMDERPRPLTLLAMSRLHPVKALDVLIDAFAMATTRIAEPWQLVIAGDGDAAYVRGLHERAARSPAAPHIRFAGWTDGAAKTSLLREAGLYVLPSHHENFGVSLAEALACGTPAVVSRQVLVASELEAAGAGWVTGNDVDALADTLATAMRDPGARVSRGAAARRFAETLAWPRVVTLLMQAYARVIDTRASTRVA